MHTGQSFQHIHVKVFSYKEETVLVSGLRNHFAIVISQGMKLSEVELSILVPVGRCRPGEFRFRISMLQWGL